MNLSFFLYGFVFSSPFLFRCPFPPSKCFSICRFVALSSPYKRIISSKHYAPIHLAAAPYPAAAAPQHHYDHHVQPLLSSLLKYHQSSRSTSAQVHCLWVTTGLHGFEPDEDAMMIWNALLRHYSQGSLPEEAFLLYRQMQDASACASAGHHQILADTFTISFLLKACANLLQLDKGAQIHSLAIKKGFGVHVYVQTALLDMYCSCGSLPEAEWVFDEMLERNTVTWNAMITGLARWGKLDRARSLFDQMPNRNVVSWTGVIDGYARVNRPLEALIFFQQMLAEGPLPSEITVLAIIPAISNLGALDMGELTHVSIRRRMGSSRLMSVLAIRS